MSHKLKNFIRQLVPPVVWNSIRYARSTLSSPSSEIRECEYIPEGWKYQIESAEGWNHSSISDIEKTKWNEFVRLLEGTDPVGIAHEAAKLENRNLPAHHSIMCFGYVLAMVGNQRSTLSILDYGGGLGHYFLFARALLPSLKLSYFCMDLASFCSEGKKLLPEVTFFDSPKQCDSHKYEIIFASGSFHYTKDWKALLKSFVEWSSSYVFLTRVPTVRDAATYVMIQRPYRYGYQTEYLGWVLNRKELLQYCRDLGLILVREFLVAEGLEILNAPEQPDFCGFLFRKENLNGTN
jgi:putative methyltransferase (TIGR04325 family)